MMPPGPLAWFQVLPNTLGVLRNPGGTFERLRRRHGDPFSMRTVNGRIALTAEPAGIRAMFTAPTETFKVFAPQAVRPLLGSRSVLTLDGPAHLRARRLMLPPLHGAALGAMARAMAECADQRAAEAAQAGVVVAQEFGQRVALDVIFRTIFGVADVALGERLRSALAGLMAATNPLLLFAPPLQRSWFPPHRRFASRRTEFDEALREAVRHVEADPDAPPSATKLFLQARDEDGRPLPWEELRDHLVTLLVAGHETTAVALAWALWFIHARPVVEERLRAELDSEEQLYLEAVCHETLRLYPIVAEVLRELAVPWEWCGHALPAGTSVAAVVWLAHRREASFPEAEEFRPERFLGKMPPPWEYLPFGGGQRRCIGAGFALQEMQIALRALLRAGRWRLADPAFPGLARRNVTMGPGREVRLVRREK